MGEQALSVYAFSPSFLLPSLPFPTSFPCQVSSYQHLLFSNSSSFNLTHLLHFTSPSIHPPFPPQFLFLISGVLPSSSTSCQSFHTFFFSPPASLPSFILFLKFHPFSLILHSFLPPLTLPSSPAPPPFLHLLLSGGK